MSTPCIETYPLTAPMTAKEKENAGLDLLNLLDQLNHALIHANGRTTITLVDLEALRHAYSAITGEWATLY